MVERGQKMELAKIFPFYEEKTTKTGQIQQHLHYSFYILMQL